MRCFIFISVSWPLLAKLTFPRLTFALNSTQSKQTTHLSGNFVDVPKYITRYGIDPLLACPPPASSSMEAARRRAQEEQGRIAFRKNKIELMRFILSCGEPKYASSIEVDAHGDPVYRERDSRHGCCVLCADAQDWR